MSFIFLFTCLLLQNGVEYVCGAVLSSSKLEACVNDGSDDLECEMKMVLLVTLEHGQGDVEGAQFMVRDASSETDGKKSLAKPWRVGWRKTSAFWRYPVRYVQDVNNKPTEHIAKLGWNECSDNPGNVDEELTCGAARTAGGERVPDSEGFCCGCDIEDIKAGLLTRGGLECGVFSLEESAHCLGFDNLWYSILEVDRPQIFYAIQVSLARPSNPHASWNNVSYSEETLVLSQQQPMAASADGSFRLQLVGDLATATAPHRFESKYLAIPSTKSHPRFDKESPMRHAMLIDRSLFDLSGLSCDKIGVSYSAFKRQPQTCEVRPGACLRQQLDDFHKEDVDRLENGERPRYLVSGFCDGAVELGKQKEGAKGTTHFLACPLAQRHTTLMRLEARADEAMFVTNVASGRIVSAAAKEFEALQGGGEILVSVVSTGRVPAAFTVGIANCTGGVAAAPAFIMSLRPYQSGEHKVRIYAKQDEGGKFNCTATLHGALGDLLDSKHVDVNVTDLERSAGTQIAVERPGSETDGGGGIDGGTCATVCPTMMDVPCFIIHSCWDRLIGVLVGIGLLCCCCSFGAYAVKRGWARRCIVFFLCPGASAAAKAASGIGVHVHVPAPQPYLAPAVPAARRAPL